MGARVTITGSVTTGPTSPTAANGLTTTVGLGDQREYGVQVSATIPVSGTDGSPASIVPGGLTKLRLVSLRSINRDPLVALVSWSGGTAQRVPFDEQLLIHVARPEVWLTLVQVVGTGVLEYSVSGD